MSSTIALQELFKAGFDDFAIPSYETAPFTTIQNRAQVTRSLKAIAGIERVHVKGLNRLPNEFGPNGEQVFEAENKDARIRFVGGGYGLSDTDGSYVGLNTIGDFIEVTFYGTGLNFLSHANSSSRDLRASVDGGAEGSNLYPVSLSSVLNSRNYAYNQIINIVSGLTLGWHTVKIRCAVAILTRVYGFEILNQRTDLAVYAGAGISNGAFTGLSALSTSAFNAEVVGTRGARVVKYIKDGELKSAVQEVDASAAYLAAANHANEEVVRRINFREFGANRADDFSTLAGVASSRAFTLDDGTTTLTASAVSGGASTFGIDVIGFPTAGTSSVTLTFVGTGLDVVSTTAAGFNGTFAVSVDGGGVGNITAVPSGVVAIKIASGLPYGTHVVKFLYSTISGDWALADFITYQPKKPSIPAGAIEVADYNLMASFVANTTAGIETIATGILRKQSTREFVYTGTFLALFDATNNSGGFNVNSATAGNKIIYRFFGTGLEIRPGGSAANTFTVSVNGSTNLSSLTTSTYGANIALTAATGTVVQSVAAQAGQGISIRGLSLGLHTIELTKVSGAGGMSATFDIITPIHINNPTLKVGSQSLKSVTKYSPEKSASNVGPDLSKAKAWIVFDGANQVIEKSYNISAFLRNTTGQYTVYFEKPFKNEFYTCSYQGATSQGIISLAGTPDSGNPEGKKSNRFTFTTTNTTGGRSEAPTNTSLVFFGETIDE